MDKKIGEMKGDETAYPLLSGKDREGDLNYYHTGLTIRQHFANSAMIGILANPNCDRLDKISDVAKVAVAAADALIEELNK